MSRICRSKKSPHSDENTDMGSTHHKRLYSRTKVFSHVVPSPTVEALAAKTNVRLVRIRLVFIRIGEIDTLNEKYQADVYYEAKWRDTVNITTIGLTPVHQSQLLTDNGTIKLTKTDPQLHIWTPQLLLENGIGQIGEQDKWLTLKRNHQPVSEQLSPPMINVLFCEHHRIKGIFWEKLELYHFPADVQDLTVSITTHHHTDSCILIQDEQIRSSINREAFVDQQEWTLYEHVATESSTTKEEYSFDVEDTGVEQKKHPILSVTCRAARRPGYYYWNGFCLIFLITVCSFCIFSITPDLPQNRLQITCTLLLTSVTFRWVVNKSLPTISYLTTLDKYAIISIVMLVILCIWHSVIAAVVFLNNDPAAPTAIDPRNIYVIVDRYMFISIFTLYILIHFALIIWLICVPYKRRREMVHLDNEYRAKKHIQLHSVRARYKSARSPSQDLVFRRVSMTTINTPTIPYHVRPMQMPDNVSVIPTNSVFLPILERTDEKVTSKFPYPPEVREQDDVFYDHTNDINDQLRKTQIQPIQNS